MYIIFSLQWFVMNSNKILCEDLNWYSFLPGNHFCPQPSSSWIKPYLETVFGFATVNSVFSNLGVMYPRMQDLFFRLKLKMEPRLDLQNQTEVEVKQNQT